MPEISEHRCPKCEGTGKKPHPSKFAVYLDSDCPRCAGLGVVRLITYP